ncbi:exosortase-dependent surface protein XDP1 [Methylomonas sp. MK1]|uniref:exosortase-dependent surface protein XDP1 n=1 Tax=Methylomonas sp. MK1 TaxID=1131552 RepID=UPI001360B0BD|nr:exosortase-dependent surface protein XDP1 [Methylomonas sp. MK1]
MLKLRYLLLPLALAPLSAQAAVDYQWTFTNTATCVSNCKPILVNDGSNGGYLDNTKPSGGDSQYVAGVDSNGKGNSQTFNQSSGLAATVNVSAFSGSTTLGTATLALYGGGLGASSTVDGNIQDAPEHAFDNNTSTDVGLFKFSTDVNLQNVAIGWSQTDRDISVLAYKPTGGNPSTPATLVGQTLASLITSGWQWIGNYSISTVNGAGNTNINAGNVSSSYWLITAASSAFGGTVDGNSDYFKISGIGGNKVTSGGGGGVGSVPEPTSLLLLAGGILGWRMNRKTQVLAA